jgi:hypothetical protein
MSGACARVPRVEKTEDDHAAGDKFRTDSKATADVEPGNATSISTNPQTIRRTEAER